MKYKLLTEDDVKDIKMMLLFSHMSQVDIARYKGVGQSTVSQIKNGDIYRSIDID